jgi:K+-transporting ATPase A subunit
MPGWAMGTATALAAFQLGKIPGGPDKGTVIIWTYVILASCVVLVSLGRKIERTLEWANWIMMFVVLAGLLILDIFIVPASIGSKFDRFFRFGYVPKRC